MKKFLITSILSAGLLAMGIVVYAANPFAISFPIPELGNCGSMNECKTYCDDANNIDACIAYAEGHGLVSKKKEPEQVKVLNLGETGPGGCKGHNECKTYCDDPEHLDECIDFGVKKGFIKSDEASRIKSLSGKGPGGCRGRERCDDYCRNEDHSEECLNFAEEHGLMSKNQATQARKFIAVSKQGGPGGCRGEECRNFCSDPANQQTCFEFAKKQGLIPQEELDNFDRSRELNKKIENGGGPGGCKNEGECMKYCSDPSRVDECLNFAEKSGVMTKEQARQGLEQFKQFQDFNKRGGPSFKPNGPQGFGPPPRFGSQVSGQAIQFSGPGGCSSPQACAEFCSNPENQETCVATFRRGEQVPQPQGQFNQQGEKGDFSFPDGQGFRDKPDFQKEAPNQFRGEPNFKEVDQKQFKPEERGFGQFDQLNNFKDGPSAIPFLGKPENFPGGQRFNGNSQNQFGPPPGMQPQGQFNQQQNFGAQNQQQFAPPQQQSFTAPQEFIAPSFQQAPSVPMPTTPPPAGASVIETVLNTLINFLKK